MNLRHYLLIVLCCWADLVFGIICAISQHRPVNGHGFGTVWTVPAVVAFKPRQLTGHGGEQVAEGPSNDDVVVEANIQGYDDHSVAHTFGKSRK